MNKNIYDATALIQKRLFEHSDIKKFKHALS